MRIQGVVSAVAFAAAVGIVSACAGSPTAPDPTINELRAAPLVSAVAGVRVELQVALWRNFQPTISPDGSPLIIAVRLGQAAAPLTVDRLWLLSGDQMWTGVPAQNAGTPEWVSRDGPKWEPGVTVDVVARMHAQGSAAQLVRAADQKIVAVY